jgi:hypothetical protein
MVIRIIRAGDALPELFRLQEFCRQHTTQRRAEHRAVADLVTALAPEPTLDQLEALHAAELTRLHTVIAALALIRRGLSQALPPEVLS